MIGWYVHGQGRGHLQRLQCVAAHLRTPVTGLSSLPRPDDFDGDWLDLPDDLPRGRDADPTAGGTLHWAPLGHPGLRDRMAAIARWVAVARPSLVVVDVSVEVAVLVRSMGVPVVVAAMRGDRRDRAHTTAYDLADALLAPWPASRPEPWPQAWLDKTWHVGALSRLDGRTAQPPPGEQRVAVLWGRGGSDVTAADVDAAATATPGWTWDARGLSGTATDPWTLLQEADVVVTHGGQNALAEVAVARRPAIVLPQHRPHDEQRANARALTGLAVVRDHWPAPRQWPALLELAQQQDVSQWTQWSDGRGAQRAAALLDARVAS
ncbi:MAG: hypothetical protein JWN08_36 [Frankiales bacterium]|nr:hypothetical protein [Frankiales bacterium]